MATLALAAPSTAVSGSPGGGVITGVTLPATAANSVASYTGVSVPNNGAVLVYFTTGSGSAPAISFVVQFQVLGETPAAFAQTLGASVTALYGPFPPSKFNDANGLLQMTLAGTLTNTAVNVYQLPGLAV